MPLQYSNRRQVDEYGEIPDPVVEQVEEDSFPQSRGITYRPGGEVGTAAAITNEFMKSYGFKFTGNGAEWSLDNIIEQFKESPTWTTIDYLTLAAPVLKWGSAARAVSKGIGAVGAGYRTGRFAGKFATGFGGRMTERVARLSGAARPEELGYAAELYSRSIRQGPVRQAIDTAIGGSLSRAGKLVGSERLERAGQFITKDRGLFSTPGTLSDDYMNLVDEFGAQPWERRGIDKAFKRELAMKQAVNNRIIADAQKLWTKAGIEDPKQQALVNQFLETAVSPRTPVSLHGVPIEGTNLVESTLGKRGAEAYEATWEVRNRLHEAGHDLGLLSDPTYLKNLEQYSPRMYKVWTGINEKIAKLTGGGGSGKGKGAGGVGHFLPRVHPDAIEGLERALDPRATLDSIGKALWVVENHRFSTKIAGSVLAKSSDELTGIAERLLGGDKKLQRLMEISDAQLGDIRSLMGNLATVDRPAAGDEIAGFLGWKKLGWGGAEKIPGFFDRLPEGLKDKYIDPVVQADLLGMASFGDNPNIIKAIYDGSMATFKASKTAYHPATIVRNFLGNVVQNHLVTGGVPKLLPLTGVKAMREALTDPEGWYKGARDAGLLGRAFISRSDLDDAFGKGVLEKYPGQESAIEWVRKVLPESAGNLASKVAAKAENFYRSIDEVWKLDAWITASKQYVKAGHSMEDARRLALTDVTKYMQNFASNSEFGELASKYIPFASFTTEATRIWKNAMTDKPHLAFFWNHIMETAGQALGAMGGFSVDELEAAQGALPEYMKGKKLLALPFNVDGNPQFVDMSYLIPMANLVEAENSEKLFFVQEYLDPLQNPLLGLGAAAVGYDPFSGRALEPKFTERQLGIPLDAPGARRIAGFAEYTASLLLPPLVPPGYAGINLMELVRGQKSPLTGENLEDGVVRTVLANVAGIRKYTGGPEALIQTAEKKEREIAGRIGKSWDRWEAARANGDPQAMLTERARISALRQLAGDDQATADDYFIDNAPRHDVGAYANLGKRELEGIMERAKGLPGSGEKDQRIMSALTDRYQRMVERGKDRRKRGQIR